MLCVEINMLRSFLKFEIAVVEIFWTVVMEFRIGDHRKIVDSTSYNHLLYSKIQIVWWDRQKNMRLHTRFNFQIILTYQLFRKTRKCTIPCFVFYTVTVGFKFVTGGHWWFFGFRWSADSFFVSFFVVVWLLAKCTWSSFCWGICSVK